ncbi:MAG: helix-turn-helix transcriptional regulator [Xanthomonadales bacterium]|nr:helix-turn-helix transcriptional regulator [Xanthomonadales bacterium]
MPGLELFLVCLTCVTLGVNLLAMVQSLWKKDRPYQYLAMFFMASSINYLDDLFWQIEGWKWCPSFVNIYIPFLMLMPPALYLYLKGLVKEKQPVHFFSQHGLGFWLALFLCLPYYLFDSTEKLNRLEAPAGTLTHHGLVTWGPTLALMALIPLGLIYVILSFKLLNNNLLKVKSFFSDISDKSLSWVRWILVTLVLVWLVSTSELLLPSNVTEKSVWALGFGWFELSWSLCFALLALNQQPVLVPKLTHKKTGNEQGVTKKYKKAPLSMAEIEDIKERLSSSAREHHLHRKSDLSLQNLAEHLDVSANKLSQVLNIHLNQGFYDYINNLRIKDACHQLIQSDQNILDIAFLVGFNSKSTFNKAFKKHTNTTPSAYKQQQSQIN